MESKEKQNSKGKSLSIEEKIQILINYGNIGNIKRRKNAEKEEKKLGEIASSLRIAYKEGRLSEEQIKLLESHGMTWGREEVGRSMLDLLISSGRNISDIKQKGKDLTPEERRLGEAKHGLIVAYKKGKLSDEIIREAEAHGMTWKREEVGRSMLDLLISSGINIRDIKQKGKDLTPEERRLGEAKHHIKMAYRRGALSDEIIREAEAHGMVWDEQEVGRRTLDLLISSGRNIGDIKQRGKDLTEEERRLGKAKHSLIIAYRKGVLSDEIIKQAEAHGMIWGRQEVGRKALDLLISSGRNIGDIKQRGKDFTEEERNLGNAKHSLKVSYNRGLLSQKIIKEAEAHGMVWREIKSRRVSSKLSALKRQKEELEDKEEKARALLEEVQEQAQRQEGEQSKDTLGREER